MVKGKKFIAVFLCLLLASMSFLLAACGEEEEDSGNDPSLLVFMGVTFNDATFTYDGEAHSLEVSGDIPDGTDVSYANNEQTDAGTYEVTATLTNSAYNSLTLSATLTIEKATYVNVYMNDDSVLYDGEVHSLEVSGDIPDGTTITYLNNYQTEAGEYTVAAALENPNYEDMTLTATLLIYTVSDVVTDVVLKAEEVLANVFEEPDPWGFLPETLWESNMAYSAQPASGTDFEEFVSVSSMGTKLIGEQLDVLYDGLDAADTAIQYASVFFDAATAITELYQTYINDNPDDCSLFESSIEIAGVTFSLTVETDGSDVYLYAGNDSLSIELQTDSSDDATYSNIGRVNITSGIALKYAMGADALKIGIEFTVADVGVIQQLEFVRAEDGTVTGSLYAFYGTESVNIDTSALLYFDDDYTVVVSDNRESDDLSIDAYVEVYDTQTGKLIGGEVAETVSLVDYDTYWFNLYDVDGIDTVKATEWGEDDDSSLNANAVYLNGSETVLETKLMGVSLSYNVLKSTSRRYDVEMKNVSYIVGTEEDGYEKVSTEIPMLFVQAEYLDTFSDDVSAKNDYLTLSLDTSISTLVNGYFSSYSSSFSSIQGSTLYSEIVSFIETF